MLQRSFIQIPGVGVKTETRIWESGIFSWQEFLKSHNRVDLPTHKISNITEYLNLSIRRLNKNDVDFFANTLPSSETWRLYPEFKDKVAFLDIETTGLSFYYNEITLIGVFDGNKIKTFIEGKNLDNFIKGIKKYRLIVTYNGSLFDLPFIKKRFPAFAPPVHIDLRFFLRRLGYQGGLKAIEKQFGIRRPKEIEDVDGFGATILWNRYRRGDVNSLKLLIEYNIADITNLKTLMEKGYNMMRNRTLYNYDIQKEQTRTFERRRTAPKVAVNKRTKSKVSVRIGGTNISLEAPKQQRYKIFSLLRQIKRCNKKPLVVGIDLSGSEKKASGWAVLKSDWVEAKLLKTDEEIIKETIRVKPEIISIDSPLSIPEGRCCTRDNCECRKFGIIRECERILFRRGIHVFPCLLPSMQSLTQRGMLLAKKFSRRGFRVIESYPGAAQDILGIIRKKVNIDELKQGLNDFGIKGDYLFGKNNHDKLDAITSALVGYFYLSKNYEAIGNKKEGYLIIPESVGRKR